MVTIYKLDFYLPIKKFKTKEAPTTYFWNFVYVPQRGGLNPELSAN
jgi:hypothetical protein